MESKTSRAHLKRRFIEDEDDGDNKQPAKKRVRFPKGKKLKPGEQHNAEVGSSKLTDPRLAAKERARHRRQSNLETEEVEITTAEVAYEDNENFVEDGIQMEPFNLNKEREEGYFDEGGNFVEYVNEDDLKDAWLDSVEAESKVAGTVFKVSNNEDNHEDATQDLSAEDIGVIKRRIANVLEPGETVLQGLRRLKGTSNNRKEKMSAETKHVFDQLTEDAMKLMENGEYNVYHERQEVFEREAEGYENLAKVRGNGISADSGEKHSNANLGNEIFSETHPGVASFGVHDASVGTSHSNSTAADISNNDAEAYDMFADDDEEDVKPTSEPNLNAVSQASSNVEKTVLETGDMQNDYAYDESSGYYYSSSLGYYYDPSTALYCSAASGLWYSYNEKTGTYEEVHEVASGMN
ncbi:hypothetical protein SLEP1_g22430 [Rubroshorea leprosula]|uniref:OCRE domain-containing protein n=1 Tax=Rubroshorea leprosula TaxID=152421 RepID=A0AAV5JEH9_9ROSI|nr:hypothetical protein SLEP1_g22430 [Rubroshorea leprosula]